MDYDELARAIGPGVVSRSAAAQQSALGTTRAIRRERERQGMLTNPSAPRPDYKYNPNVERLVRNALQFQHADKVIPTTEQKALDGVATTVLDELAVRASYVNDLQYQLDRVEDQLSSTYDTFAKEKSEANARTESWRKEYYATRDNAETWLRQLCDISIIVLGDENVDNDQIATAVAKVLRGHKAFSDRAGQYLDKESGGEASQGTTDA